MPDMASLSLCILVLWLFDTWLDREENLQLFTALSLVTSLAVLVKLPALIIGIPLLYMSWTKYGPHFLFQRRLWVYAMFSLIPPLAWYVHAYFLSQTHFPHHMFGSGLLQIVEVSQYATILLRTTTNLTIVTSALMVAGIILPTHNQCNRLFHWWLLAIILFVVFVGEGNFRHAWYQLPLVPVAAAFAGLACDFSLRKFIKGLDSKVALVSVCLFFFAALAYVSYIYVQPLYKAVGIASLNGGIELDHIAPRDALVITADNGDPTTIYYSRRKGWHFPQGSVLRLPWPADGQQAISEFEMLRTQGGSYLIFTKSTFYLLSGQYTDFQKHLDSQYRRVRDTDEYIIFDLAGK